MSTPPAPVQLLTVLAAILLALAAPASADLTDPIVLLSGPDATNSGDGYTFGLDTTDVTESITPDGRYIAFMTQSTVTDAGVPDNNSNEDIIWRDLQTGQVKLVSINAAGTAASNGDSEKPAISDDGRYVAFDSTSTDLITGFTDDNGSSPDVYVRDMTAGTTTLLSHDTTSATKGANATVLEPLISGDGHRVVFYGKATNIETPDVQGGGAAANWHLYATALPAVTTQVVDPNAGATAFAAGNVGEFDISTDGRWVSFASEANDLINGTTNPHNGVDAIYRRDLQTGTTVLASPATDGPLVRPNDTSDSFPPAISDDGRYITFESGADDLVPGFTDNDSGVGADVYQRDISAGTTTLVSAKVGNTTGDDQSELPRMTPDGRYVIFLTHADDVIPGDTNNHADLLRWDRTTGTSVLINRAASTNVPSSGGQYVDVAQFGNGGGAISDDGRYVVFSTDDDDLVAGQSTAGHTNVFLRDVTLGTTVLVSGAGGSATTGGDNESNAPWLSALGTRMTFQSYANDLIPGFVRHSYASATDLYARATGVVLDTGGSGGGGGTSDGDGDGNTTTTPTDTSTTPTTTTPPDTTTTPTTTTATDSTPPPATTSRRRPKGISKRGTPHRDLLVGTPGPDHLWGLAGPDTIKGLGSNDVIDGGPGRDVLRGGGGNDTIKAYDHERDIVDCGPGVDHAIVDRKDKVVNCEKVTRKK